MPYTLQDARKLQDEAKRKADEATDDRAVAVCHSCKKGIDPDVCWCGEYLKGHSSEHGVIPMGCECGMDKQYPILEDELINTKPTA